ncbi:Interferon-induced protein 44-like [Trebouxia sp. C0009 RCD-2024]
MAAAVPRTRSGLQQHIRTEKFEILQSDHAHAQYSDSSRGPAFGAGHDLLTFTTSGLALSTTPRSYPTSGPLINSIVPKKPSSFQLEVLQVTIESDGAGELELPWVQDVDWSVEDGMRLQKELCNFTLAVTDLPIKYINLLLFGGVGAGKSNIVSTVDSLFQGRISRRAPHGQGTGSLTRELHQYTFINPDSKREVQWQLWDIMGWNAKDYQGWQLGLVLDGRIPDRVELDDIDDWKFWRKASDDAYMARLRDMRQLARDRGIPTLVFLTKIDKCDPDVIGKDLKKTFLSGRLLSLIEELVESSGVGGRKDIMPIKNFSEGMTSTAEVRVLVCRALQQALFAAVDQLRERKNVSWDEMMVARWAITHVKLMFTYLWHWVLSWR